MAVPAAGIECWIIKFDPCVCFDYFSVVTSEALRPWGDMSISQLQQGTLAVAETECVCALCMCLSRSLKLALASSVAMVFPNREEPDQ